MNRFPISSTVSYITLFILIAAGYIGFTLIFGTTLTNGIQTINPFLLISSLVTLFGLFVAVRRSFREKWTIRISWLLFAVAYFFDTFANILKVLYSQTDPRDPVFFMIMVSYTFISLGIVLLPSAHKPGNVQSRNSVDMLILTPVILISTWIFLGIPFFFYQVPLFDQLFASLTFVMIFTVFDLLLRRNNYKDQNISLLLCLSITATVIGEILIAIQRSNSSLWIDIVMNLCWIVSYAAIGTAGLTVKLDGHPEIIKDSFPASKPFTKDFGFIMPPIWAGLSFCLMVWSHYHPEILPFSVIAAGTGSLIIILFIRLAEAVKENARLIKDAHKEIDTRKLMQEKFWHDSLHDALTSLPNRSFLVDQLQAAIEMTREKNAISSTLLFLDLDRFKTINDKYGHSSGDKLLKAFSERLIFCVRPDDFVARLGGDEFAILLNNLQSSQTVYKVASRIMEKMKEPFEIEGDLIISGVSFGICFILPEFTSPEDILKEADKAMYRAKRKGRGRFETSRELEF